MKGTVSVSHCNIKLNSAHVCSNVAKVFFAAFYIFYYRKHWYPRDIYDYSNV